MKRLIAAALFILALGVAGYIAVGPYHCDPIEAQIWHGGNQCPNLDPVRGW